MQGTAGALVRITPLQHEVQANVSSGGCGGRCHITGLTAITSVVTGTSGMSELQSLQRAL